MSELDPTHTSTDKPRSENDEVSKTRYRRRRNLFRGVLVAAIIAMFAITYILLSSDIILDGSTAPVIDAVDYYREYKRNEWNNGGIVVVQLTIQYHDREGDVSKLESKLGEIGKNISWIYSSDENTRPSIQRSGAVMTSWFECAGRVFHLTINLMDQLGNQSNTIDETIECFIPEMIPTVHFQATGTASAKSQE